MLFGKKPYPILPTSESDTLTFLQKLDLLEYKVSEMNNKIYEIETTLATKSSVSATASDGVIQTITVDGTSYNVPQGTEVSATGSEGTLETLTVDGTTYNIPQDAGISGIATIGSYSVGQWKLVDGMFFFEIVSASDMDAFSDNAITVRLKDSDNDIYNGLDGKTLKTVISWLHKENSTTWPVWAEVQMNIVYDGLGTITLPKGAHVLSGSSSLYGDAVLADLKGLPLTFMNVPTL